eukprot:COSAG01_NODE_6207_length_3795_cov_57.087392_1_plen_195_part_10
MGASEKAAARVRLANKATHALQLRATIPALGLATFVFKRTSSSAAAAAAAATVPNGEDEISNGVYTLRFDREAGLIVSLTNEALKRTIALNVTCERTQRPCSLPSHDRTERQAVVPACGPRGLVPLVGGRLHGRHRLGRELGLRSARLQRSGQRRVHVPAQLERRLPLRCGQACAHGVGWAARDGGDAALLGVVH